MDRMEPSLVALLGGMGGAILMLLLVLLVVIALALPVLRAVVRFVGNFDNLSAQRRGGRILVTGGLDDWRDDSRVEREIAIANGKPLSATPAAFEADARRGQS